MKTQNPRMTPSDLKYNVERANIDGHFFERSSMNFFWRQNEQLQSPGETGPRADLQQRRADYLLGIVPPPPC